MAEKNSFILLTKYGSIFAEMSDRQAGVLIKAIFHYVATGETMASLNDVEVKTAFKFVKLDLDYNQAKYDALCKSRSEYGKQGAQAKASISKHKPISQAKASISKHNDNDNDDDNELVDKSTNNITPLPPLKKGVECFSFVANEYKATFDKWLTYKKERKQSYKGAISARQCYNQLLELSGNNAAIAEKIVNQSIANNWSGLFPLKEEKGALNGAVDYNRNADTSKYANLGRKIN